RIHARPPREAYVVVREAAGSGKTTSKRDLTICDAQGQVSVVLEGLTSRAHRGEGAQLLAPVWQDAPCEAQGDGKPRHARRHVLVDPALLGSGSGVRGMCCCKWRCAAARRRPGSAAWRAC
ncbi:hypothetical protein, partial [Burkholderia gladioli]|uniref:hypothetical protein n=1 Tax=Burkholderia gladioli TaxID=28095 RepID=UPI001641D069